MGSAISMWVVGMTVHLSVVAWIYMDANRRGVNGRQWAVLTFCFPGVSLIAYAKATGSGHAWLMVLVLGMGSIVAYAAYAGHAAVPAKATKTASASSQAQGQGPLGNFNPLDPSTLPKLPSTPAGVQKLFQGK